MKFLARLKYRFDIGQSFLGMINFAFLLIAASDKLTTLLHVPAKILVPVLVPAALGLVWLIGWALDRARFQEAYHHEHNARNEMLIELHETSRKASLRPLRVLHGKR